MFIDTQSDLSVPGSSAVGALIDLALEEDIGHGDITTAFLDISGRAGQGIVRARQMMVIAGLDVACRVFKRMDHNVRFEAFCKDGDMVADETVVAKISGDMAALLTAERTALNFLQRLSGVATHVRRFTQSISNNNIRLVDTRKTTPGWRALEKYAVRVGGAHNHRMGLYDGVLIKDNHIAAAGGIDNAVRSVRAQIHHLVRIEVETASISEVKEALAAGVDVIMLDNMGLDEIKEAVSIIDGRAVVEVSGGVTAADIDSIAAAGVDVVSVGALTHGATFVDISMDILLSENIQPPRIQSA